MSTRQSILMAMRRPAARATTATFDVSSSEEDEGEHDDPSHHSTKTSAVGHGIEQTTTNPKRPVSSSRSSSQILATPAATATRGGSSVMISLSGKRKEPPLLSSATEEKDGYDDEGNTNDYAGDTTDDHALGNGSDKNIRKQKKTKRHDATSLDVPTVHRIPRKSKVIRTPTPTMVAVKKPVTTKPTTTEEEQKEHTRTRRESNGFVVSGKPTTSKSPSPPTPSIASSVSVPETKQEITTGSLSSRESSRPPSVSSDRDAQKLLRCQFLRALFPSYGERKIADMAERDSILAIFPAPLDTGIARQICDEWTNDSGDNKSAIRSSPPPPRSIASSAPSHAQESRSETSVSSSSFSFAPKPDGIRQVILILPDGRMYLADRLFCFKQLPCDPRFAQRLCQRGPCIFDAELVHVMNRSYVAQDILGLAPAGGGDDPRVEGKHEPPPLSWYELFVFDAMCINGLSLLERSYSTRCTMLRNCKHLWVSHTEVPAKCDLAIALRPTYRAVPEQMEFVLQHVFQIRSMELILFLDTRSGTCYPVDGFVLQRDRQVFKVKFEHTVDLHVSVHPEKRFSSYRDSAVPVPTKWEIRLDARAGSGPPHRRGTTDKLTAKDSSSGDEEWTMERVDTISHCDADMVHLWTTQWLPQDTTGAAGATKTSTWPRLSTPLILECAYRHGGWVPLRNRTGEKHIPNRVLAVTSALRAQLDREYFAKFTCEELPLHGPHMTLMAALSRFVPADLS